MNSFGGLGDSHACVCKNVFLWSLGLFIPTPAQINGILDNASSSLQSGKVATSFFLFFYQLKSLASTSTPISTVSEYSFTVPTSITGGTYATSSFPLTIDVGLVPESLDLNATSFVNSIIAIYFVFVIGLMVVKLIL